MRYPPASAPACPGGVCCRALGTGRWAGQAAWRPGGRQSATCRVCHTTGTQTGLPSPFNANDGFTNGGCPAFVPNAFQGANDATLNAANTGGQFNSSSPAGTQQTQSFSGAPRIGHESALQRSSGAADGTPIHIRVDGPGLSSLDVPAFQTFPGGTNVAAGSVQPKLEFAVFMPTADDNGLERFIIATRRQNFLIHPARSAPSR